MSSAITALCLFCLLVIPISGFSETTLPDTQQETQARELFRQFRCPSCQSESIADSNADIAKDLRALVRERVAKGESDAEIKTYLVTRYGDGILMQPPVKQNTWLLWFGPFLMLIIGIMIARNNFRKQAS